MFTKQIYVEQPLMVTLTLSVGLHTRRRVDGISKQTVPGHFQPDHAGTHRTYKTQVKSHVTAV